MPQSRLRDIGIWTTTINIDPGHYGLVTLQFLDGNGADIPSGSGVVEYGARFGSGLGFGGQRTPPPTRRLLPDTPIDVSPGSGTETATVELWGVQDLEITIASPSPPGGAVQWCVWITNAGAGAR